MLEWLRRHPVPIVAHFTHSLVLTYAFPAKLLRPMLPPGLVLDTLDDTGFAAVALVQTERLRPSFVSARLGQSFFLSGYRIFVRRAGQPSLRGLYILRSDTDRRSMALLGNLLTHYRYRLAKVSVTERPGELEIEVRTPDADADVHVLADLESRPAPLPAGSPFRTLDEARRFAGPLPHTFDYEASTRSLVVVRARRGAWDPQPITVDVRQVSFFKGEPFGTAAPTLANAFHVAGTDYRWERGIVVPTFPGDPSRARSTDGVFVGGERTCIRPAGGRRAGSSGRRRGRRHRRRRAQLRRLLRRHYPTADGSL